MGREYVAVLARRTSRYGNGMRPDEIVKSCMASSRKVAERRLNADLYLVMTRRQADARGILDLRDRTQFCR